jgi:hypothetical protein
MSDHTPPCPAATAAVILLAVLLSFSGCAKNPTEPTSIVGRWTGYNTIGTGSDGWITLAIAQDRSCEVTGSISGDHGGWGEYRLRFEGTPTYYNNEVFGDIYIWRYRPGVDTVRVDAWLSGIFTLKYGSASGTWFIQPDQAFTADGNWAATKEK